MNDKELIQKLTDIQIEEQSKKQKKIGKVMREFKSGTLKSGGSGKKVTNPTQAIAIALAAGDTFNIQGDANIAPLAAMGWSDGTWGESTWGDGLYRPDTDDIFPLTASLGTATLDANTIVDLTGVTLQTVQLGSVTVTGTGNVILTGNSLTIGQGTGTNVLIWNAVDTGSAPTTPPGWKEVPTNAA